MTQYLIDAFNLVFNESHKYLQNNNIISSMILYNFFKHENEWFSILDLNQILFLMSYDFKKLVTKERAFRRFIFRNIPWFEFWAVLSVGNSLESFT